MARETDHAPEKHDTHSPEKAHSPEHKLVAETADRGKTLREKTVEMKATGMGFSVANLDMDGFGAQKFAKFELVDSTKSLDERVSLGGDKTYEKVTPQTCSPETKSTWNELSKIHNDKYNCEFAVLAYLDPNMAKMAAATDGAAGIASLTIPGIVRQSLKDHGYEKQNLTLESGGHKAGEVLMVNGPDGAHAAIVGKVSPDGHIERIEQKPNPTDPPVAMNVKEFKDAYKPERVEVYQKKK